MDFGALPPAPPQQQPYQPVQESAGIEPEAGISAIEMASRAVSKMKLGRIDQETTANVGTIRGGKATNIIPERVEITGEARSLNEASLQRQVSEMEKSLREAAAEFSGEVEIKSGRIYPGFHVREESSLLRMIRKAAGDLNLPFNLIPSCGASDANILNGLGIPTVAFSVGMNNPHTREENIIRRDLVNSARVLLEIINCRE
jgi:tripeptide aminopeptidase